MNQFMVTERKNVRGTQRRHRGAARVNLHPAANAAFGVVGGGLGAAAAAGVGPIVVPAAIIGGLAGYFLTNRIPG